MWKTKIKTRYDYKGKTYETIFDEESEKTSYMLCALLESLEYNSTFFEIIEEKEYWTNEEDN